VSVLIPAYNEEKVIARTIEAVLASRYPDLEIVIVDDGSVDDTSGEVTRRFGDRPEVRLLRQNNGGKSSALNHGITIADGDIIVALDADTLFLPDTISKLVRRFKRALERAGVHQITFHELRHTFGTRMAAAGTPMRTLQHWMGHADSKTTQIYAHYQPSEQEADAVDRAFA